MGFTASTELIDPVSERNRQKVFDPGKFATCKNATALTMEIDRVFAGLPAGGCRVGLLDRTGLGEEIFCGSEGDVGVCRRDDDIRLTAVKSCRFGKGFSAEDGES